jgi:hypothetical protein
MWFTALGRRPNQHRNRARVGRIANPSYRRRLFVPCLESLEDRTVLSTLTVLNSLDMGPGSLRDTITNAQSGDTIVFAPSLAGQTTTLSSDQLTLNKSLDIEGPGASLLALSGNDSNRVFTISAGYTITIAGLTLTHGRANGQGGGGILNMGSTLTLANDVLSNNEAVANSSVFDASCIGGAVANFSATLTVRDSTFSGNQALGLKNGHIARGGAIINVQGATTNVARSTFTNNRAVGGDGGKLAGSAGVTGFAASGAIDNQGGCTLTVVDSTFTGNQAIAGSGAVGTTGANFISVDFASGGAIRNHGLSLVVSGCSFSYNQAIGGSNATLVSDATSDVGDAEGGAILNLANSVVVTGSSFDHNEALGGSGNRGSGGVLIIGAGTGGAIENLSFGSPANLAVDSCTFTQNQAVGGIGNAGGALAGDGIGGAFASALVNTSTAVTTITNCTLANNAAIGGQGAAGGRGADGLGGGIANLFAASFTLAGCTLTGNQAVGGTGGAGGNGGNGFGGGLYNDGLYPGPGFSGPATLTVRGSTISGNQATGGAGGTGGSAGQGVGGGAYFAAGGTVCLDPFTVAHLLGNTASTSNNDVFGAFTICP